MKNVDKIKNANSGLALAKLLAFKVAQELHGNLNDLKSFSEFESFHETKNRFLNAFLKWLNEDE